MPAGWSAAISAAVAFAVSAAARCSGVRAAASSASIAALAWVTPRTTISEWMLSQRASNAASAAPAWSKASAARRQHSTSWLRCDAPWARRAAAA